MNETAPAHPRHSHRPSITTVITLGFGALIVVAVGLVLFLGYLSGMRNALELTIEKTTLMVESVSDQLVQHLNSAQSQIEYLAHLVKLGSLNVNDERKVLALMTASSAAAPQVEAILYVGLDGRKLWVAPRLGKPEAIIDRWQEGEPLEAWMQQLGEEHATIWGVPIFSPDNREVYLNVRTPVYVGDRPVGLFVAAVTVGALSRYMAKLSGERGVAFILAGKGRLIAHPDIESAIENRTVDDPLPTPRQVGDWVLHRAWTPGEFEESVEENAAIAKGFRLRTTYADGLGHAVVFRHVHGYDEDGWIVGSHFRLDDFAAAFDRLRNAVLAGIGVLIIAIGAATVMGRQISRPVLRLAAAAQILRKGGLEGASEAPSSRLRETAQAARAFNAMVEGLRERDLIRSTFGRFVPEKVVEDLLKQKGELPAETRLASIFFSDIEGFSTISEKLSPAELLAILNDYFTLVAAPIERLGGVVIQYQGDAVVASFNLPVHDSEHAKNAVTAALEVLERLKEQTFGPEGHRLNTRIGINTGVVVGGPVGTAGRQTYSIHGDEVNVAARIEELNKMYGTRILVAESTMELCGNDFPFEAMGKVPIRGRTQAVRLFTVPTASRAGEREEAVES